MPQPFPLVDTLATLAYFHGLAPATQALLASRALQRTYAAGEILFLEGDPAPGIFIIESGRVKIYKLSPEGNEHVLTFMGDGDTFNEIGAFEGINPANVAALSDLTVWVIPSDALTLACQKDSELAMRLVRFLARRVRMLVGRIEELALYAVTVRLARFLLKQTEDPSLSGPGITRMTIAAHLATTPQTISIALRDLEKAGAIEFDRHRIFIIDESLLRDIAML